MSNTKQMASLFSAEWKSACRRCVLNLGLISCLRSNIFKRCTHFVGRSREVRCKREDRGGDALCDLTARGRKRIDR